ncbi:MAG: ATP-binding protein, partial [Candidatus Binatia bacterium]
RPDELNGILERLRRGERVKHLETVRVCKDGRCINVLVSVSPIKSADGRITGAASIARDITEQKRAGEALRRYVQRLQALWEIDRAILALQSPAQIAKAAVSRLRQLIGCERASLAICEPGAEQFTVLATDGLHVPFLQVGRRLNRPEFGDLGGLLQDGRVYRSDDLLELDERPDWVAALIQAGLRSVIRVPLMVREELTGSLILAAAQAHAFGDEPVEIATEIATQLAVAIQQAQLHEQVQRHAEELEARVEERTAALQVANRELESFSYRISHDLRAPLRAIAGFTEILLEDHGHQLDATGQGYLRRVQTAAERMGNLIEGLLRLSRISRCELRRRRTDLSAMARDIAAELHQTQPQRQVRFQIAEGLVADADPILLQSALQNLLGNAWKYTSGHPTATIEVGVSHHATPPDAAGLPLDTPAFFVRDDGAGFDMAYAHKLFEAFQRLHGQHEFEGIGIGLATVRSIIDRHGGRIWAEGAVERGVTFYFTLPPAAEAAGGAHGGRG